MSLRVVLILLLVGVFCVPTRAEEPALRLYIDADYSIAKRGAEAIELGIRTGLAAAGGRLAGHEVEIVPLNHRANAKRSFRHMQKFLKDDRALAFIGGVHSPPYLTHRDFIHDNGILLMLPWSAAGPITRAKPGQENWVYRVSVDDSKSGDFLISQALDRSECNGVALLLLDSGWGRANKRTMNAALERRGQEASATIMFDGTIGQTEARDIADEIAQSGADCVIMLATAISGGHLVNALHASQPSIRIFSHWGILSGGFSDMVPHDTRQSAQVVVLQTCALRMEAQGSPEVARALSFLDDVTQLADVQAPTGFVHGYDLAQILAAAVEQAARSPQWSGSITDKRQAVRQALDNLETPVVGMLKTYNPPFREYSSDVPDAHESLGADDFCMASFDARGRLVHER